MASSNEVEMFGSDNSHEPAPTAAAKAGSDDEMDDLFGEDQNGAQKDDGS
jgi:hypothetical protein